MRRLTHDDCQWLSDLAYTHIPNVLTVTCWLVEALGQPDLACKMTVLRGNGLPPYMTQFQNYIQGRDEQNILGQWMIDRVMPRRPLVVEPVCSLESALELAERVFGT